MEWRSLVVDGDPDDPFTTADPADLLPAELAELLHPPAWHRNAACRGQGVTPFFPGRGEPTEPAKAICSTCPVIEECGADALARSSWDDGGGIWGGMSERQRRATRRTAA